MPGRPWVSLLRFDACFCGGFDGFGFTIAFAVILEFRRDDVGIGRVDFFTVGGTGIDMRLRDGL